MEHLIDFCDNSATYSVMSWNLTDKFGVVKSDFVASNINGNKTSDEFLKRGCLIEIISDYREERDETHFRLQDSTLCLDQVHPILKCSKDDYFVISKELWKYLLSIKIEGRIKFMQKVHSRRFDMEMLKVNRNIRIQGLQGAKVKFYDFLVKHNGEVKEIGPGLYIGLQLKGDHSSIPTELKCLSGYYNFGGIGIVVPADWIMLNLYVEDTWQRELIAKYEDSFSLIDMSAHEINLEFAKNALIRAQRQSTRIEDPNNTSYSDLNSIILASNNHDEAVQNSKQTNCELCGKTSDIERCITLRDCLHLFCLHCIRGHIECLSNNSYISCPYNKDYECPFDLLDIEIKNLVGASLYRKIINNRRKKYDLGINSNARPCPNVKCNNVWISSSSVVQHNNKRCPKCGLAWCYICCSSHEPEERHKTRKRKNRKLLTKPLLGTCANCCKPNVQLSESNTLQNCKHKFCNDCIVPMIKKQIPGSSYIQCFICQQLEDNKVNKTTGPELLQLLRDNQNKQQDMANLVELCCCKPPGSNCNIVLKCKHKFCRTFLMRILEEQLQSLSSALCPTCFEEIDDYQKKRLVDEMKVGDFEKCGTCSNQAEINLTTCKHAFCRNCISDLITNQASDLRKMSINCTICHDPVNDSDILLYGSKEIFDQFRSKIEAAILVSTPVERIILNNWSFYCESCDQRISLKREVVLTGSRDCFCLVCCKNFIGRQLSNSQIPACPLCHKITQQFEVEAVIGGKPVEKLNSCKTLIECFKCHDSFEENLIQNCSKCNNSICKKCARSIALDQIVNNQPRSCSFCKILLDETQIANITNATFSIRDSEINCDLNRTYTVEISFKCIVCKKSIDRASQIILINCKHEICRKCLCQNISNQKSKNFKPKCPVCSKAINQKQLESLLISTTSKYTTKSNQIDQLNFFQKFQTQPETISTSTKAAVKTFGNTAPSVKILQPIDICSMCYEKCQPNVILKNCRHKFCWQCEQISISLQLQQPNGTPECPICRTPIDSDEITLFYTLLHDISVDFPPLEPCTSLLKNNRLFECPICDQNIDFECGIVLKNCGDMLCRDCVMYVIVQQLTYNQTPNCPICKTRITDEEVYAIDPDVFEEKRLGRQNLNTSRHKETKSDVIEMYYCAICEEMFKLRATKVLSFCKDQFCRQCITIVLAEQTLVDKIPSCPLCCQEVSFSDIIDISGSEDFKRYMDAKRKK